MSHVDDGTLHAYIDGQLTPAERAQLEAHVSECVDCRTRLADERALVDRAGQLLGFAQPVERPAPPLHQLRPPRLVWRLRVPLAWAASVLLAVGLGYYAGGAGEQRAAPASLPQVATVPSTDSFGATRQIARFQDRPAAPPVAKAAPPPTERRGDNVAAAREEDAAAPARQEGVRAATTAPEPSPSANVVAEVGGASAGRGSTEWAIIRSGPARELLGTEPVGVPGLAVRNIRRSPAGDVVVVEQALDAETVIQVFQRRMQDEPVSRQLDRSAPAAAAAPSAAKLQDRASELLARYVGRLRVEIAGPLTADSLNRLLEQVKPIKP